ncbi:MAG: cytochrome C [Cytophagales bacterium]|nr:MAG: cytochrome C [Cytophagales bacterium]
MLKLLLIFIFFTYIFSCTNKKIDFKSSRLEKQLLCQTLEDPMEIAVSKDGFVFIIERKGKIKLYNPNKKLTKTIGKIDVDLGHEDGLLGLTLDPDFELNGWIYLLYTPVPHQVQRVSRFYFNGNIVELASEKVVIEFPIVPERHQGGSLAFDSNRNLYISTGENTIPTGINGYAPIDERKGFERSDAQRSAGNTNDLRGKILRIHPEKSGGYTIPKGNFKEKYNLKLARPEIYIMGCRNPFRIAVDKKTNTLYWGEIGPDAGSDSEKGPKGHDEINRASETGFYGWPYFIGNNKAYAKVDFETNAVVSIFDTLHPQNNSPNNTGDILLPKPQNALIWYPYDASKEFPVLGKGGRSAMAGMVYHRSLHKQNENMLPDFFENKLFIMDWMRNWIMTVELSEAGKLKSISPFMPEISFKRPMDMALGNDGCMYLLEYGENWFGNTNGNLSKIIYIRNNRNPTIKSNVFPLHGGLPLDVNCLSKGTYDLDGDSLTYKWSISSKNNPKNIIEISNLKNPVFTIKEAGEYEIKLAVTDSKQISYAENFIVNAGNTSPNLKLKISNNKTFYWNNRTINFTSTVSDAEDGISISPFQSIEAVHISKISSELEYNNAYSRGKILVENSDCKSCHALNQKSVGPTFLTISNTYQENDLTITNLGQKILNGGSGVWGNSPMSAHPQLSQDQAKLMIRYILSLKNSQNQPNIELKNGTVLLPENIENDANTFIKFKASYTDKGSNGMPSISNKDSIILKNPTMQALNYSTSGDIIETNGLARLPFPNSFISFKNVDLIQVTSINIEYGYDFYVPNCWVEIHIDAPNGKLIGKTEMKKIGTNEKFGLDKISITPTNEMKEIFIVYQPALNLHAPINIKTLTFKFNK